MCAASYILLFGYPEDSLLEEHTVQTCWTIAGKG